MSDDKIDITDAGACRLVMEIGAKAGEIFGNDNGDKTIGQWREEMSKLITEAMWFAAEKNRALKL